jgi:predicted RNA-binding protein YlxR (DUF448 family)
MADKLIKQDINFLECPIWFLESGMQENVTIDRDGFVYRAGYKLPSALDAIFLYYLLYKSQTNGWEPFVETTKYEILKNCGVAYNGFYKNRVEDSLKRWINVSLEFKGTFYDNKKYYTLNFNIINSWMIEYNRYKTINVNFNNFWLTKIQHSNYFKIINFDYMIKLRTPVAMRLYEVLVKSFQKNDEFKIGAHKLAFKLTMKEKYLAHILQKIKPALRRINEKTDLNINLEIDKKERGRAVFVFKQKGKVQKIKKIKNNNDKEKKSEYNNKQMLKLDQEVNNLLKLRNDKILKEVEKYLEIKGKDYVIQTIKFVNNQEGIKNYGGYLIKSLQEGWAEGSLELKSGSVLEYAESLKQKIKQKNEKYINFCKKYENKRVQFGNVTGRFMRTDDDVFVFLLDDGNVVLFFKIKEAIDKGAQIEILEEVLEED